MSGTEYLKQHSNNINNVNFLNFLSDRIPFTDYLQSVLITPLLLLSYIKIFKYVNIHDKVRAIRRHSTFPLTFFLFPTPFLFFLFLSVSFCSLSEKFLIIILNWYEPQNINWVGSPRPYVFPLSRLYKYLSTVVCTSFHFQSFEDQGSWSLDNNNEGCRKPKGWCVIWLELITQWKIKNDRIILETDAFREFIFFHSLNEVQRRLPFSKFFHLMSNFSV